MNFAGCSWPKIRSGYTESVPGSKHHFRGGVSFTMFLVFVFVSTPTTFQSREIVLTRIKGEKLTKIR